MTASTPLLITFGFYLLAMIGIGFVAWKRTRDFDDYILGGRSLGGYVTGAAFGPVVLFSLFWGRMTGGGALAGMVAGAATVILWKYTGSALYEMVPGVIAASVAIIVGSLLARTPGSEVLARHQQVHLSLREQGY